MVQGRSQRTQHALVLLISLTAIWGVSAYDIERNRQGQMRTAETANALQAQAFAENTLSSIKRIDELLLDLRTNWVGDSGRFSALIMERQKNIADLAFQISVIDETGYLVYSNLAPAADRIYLGDREHFRVHRETKEDRLFISKPLKGKISGLWSIQFTRPIYVGGIFKGVIVASVSPDMFVKFRNDLNLSENATIAVTRASGELMARYPRGDEFYGVVVKNLYTSSDGPISGNFTGLSQIDGIERVFGYHKLGAYKLAFFVGESEEYLLLPQRKYRLTVFSYAGAISLLLIGFMFQLGRSAIAREETQARLKQESDKNRALLRNASDGVHILDADGNVLEVSDSFCAMLGYSREELIGANVSLWDTQWSPPELKQIIAGQTAKEDLSVFETRHRRRDGSLVDVEVTGRGLELDGKKVLFNSARDITERKLAQDAARANESRLRVALSNINMAVFHQDRELRYTWMYQAQLGYQSENVVGHTDAELLPPEAARRVTELKQRVLEAGETVHGEVAVVMKDEMRVFDLTAEPLRAADGAIVGLTGVTLDITERRQAEMDLRAAEEQFRGLVEQSIAGTYIVQDGKFAYVNPRYAEIFGYGSADELIGRDFLSMVFEKDRDAAADSIRRRIEGEIDAISYEFTGLRKNGSTVDIGVHGARATHRGRPAIIGMIQDISEKKRAEEQIQRYLKQLQTAFMSTVEVATSLSEMRDPYTAGHERRVGTFAAAIGAELGLDAQRIEGLRVAGFLHDIGKITIPAEILSKPGKLSAIEYELIKGHPQSSYDVLKDVEFPWPLAEVALQHHERMDGSGYPRGLKGAAILLEAPIMAVADVVEAMSSHRPYRPGLGIEAALAEIERGRGTTYDPVVADACLRAFRQNGYQLPA